MKRTEQYVADFLTHRGHIWIHEPDGNVTPDFLVDRRIAVEARILNQHFVVNGKAEGLEI
jgi:hypothetical protein